MIAAPEMQSPGRERSLVVSLMSPERFAGDSSVAAPLYARPPPAS